MINKNFFENLKNGRNKMKNNKPEINEEFYERRKLYAKRMKSGLIYGPITSRRSGVSLGINPVKGGFLCNFDCVYCQYGNESNQKGKFSKPDEIKKALEETLRKLIKSKEKIDSLTICGPTEPLLNPKIKEITQVVIDLRNKYLPDVEIDLFTNASMPIIIPKIDKVFLKYDAYFNETERPKNKMTKSDVIQNIIRANAPRIIQSMWFKGKLGNCYNNCVKEYILDIKNISKKCPIELLQIYTILYIPSTDKIVPCSEKELNGLAKKITRETSVKTKVFYKPPKIKGRIKF